MHFQDAWLKSPLARVLLATEYRHLKRMLPQFQGHFCLHLLPWVTDRVYRPFKLKQHILALETLGGVHISETMDEDSADSKNLENPQRQSEHPGLDKTQRNRGCKDKASKASSDANESLDITLDPSKAHKNKVNTQFSALQLGQNTSVLVTDFSSLPFRDNSIDVIFLHHCLEFHPAPHSVLREASRVLLPNGALIILSFNPYSIWGLKHWLLSWSPRESLQYMPIRQSRIEDWLTLLDYRIELKMRCMFRLPVQWPKCLEWSAPLEGFSRLPWMFGGGVYIMMSRKQVGGLTPLRLKWRLLQPQRPFLPSASRLPQVQDDQLKFASIHKG